MEKTANAAYESVAVLIPCYDEALTIAGVVRDFAEKLPHADIYVGDNNSSDNTREQALSTKLCKIIDCPVQGKGAAVRTMLNEIQADYYVLVDGDGTYGAEDASLLLDMVRLGRYGMAAGNRLLRSYKGQKITHALGNRLVDKLINIRFRTDRVKDAMSGLRVFNKNIAEGFAAESKYNGFEIEVELVMWCLSNDIKICSVGCDYAQRPEGSKSKLSTFKDGLKILKAIMRSEK